MPVWPCLDWPDMETFTKTMVVGFFEVPTNNAEKTKRARTFRCALLTGRLYRLKSQTWLIIQNTWPRALSTSENGIEARNGAFARVIIVRLRLSGRQQWHQQQVTDGASAVGRDQRPSLVFWSDTGPCGGQITDPIVVMKSSQNWV